MYWLCLVYCWNIAHKWQLWELLSYVIVGALLFFVLLKMLFSFCGIKGASFTFSSFFFSNKVKFRFALSLVCSFLFHLDVSKEVFHFNIKKLDCSCSKRSCILLKTCLQPSQHAVCLKLFTFGTTAESSEVFIHRIHNKPITVLCGWEWSISTFRVWKINWTGYLKRITTNLRRFVMYINSISQCSSAVPHQKFTLYTDNLPGVRKLPRIVDSAGPRFD